MLHWVPDFGFQLNFYFVVLVLEPLICLAYDQKKMKKRKKEKKKSKEHMLLNPDPLFMLPGYQVKTLFPMGNIMVIKILMIRASR